MAYGDVLICQSFIPPNTEYILSKSNTSKNGWFTCLDVRKNLLWDHNINLSEIVENEINEINFHQHCLIMTLDNSSEVSIIPQLGTHYLCSQKSIHKPNPEELIIISLKSNSSKSTLELFDMTYTKLFFVYEENTELYIQVYDFTPNVK